MRTWRGLGIAVWIWTLVGSTAVVKAQETSAPQAAASSGDDGFSTRDTFVGYIDSAVIGDIVRIRYDDEYGINRQYLVAYIRAKIVVINRVLGQCTGRF